MTAWLEPKHQQAIDELRERIPDVITQDPKFKEDCYLAAFLKVRKFNVQKGEDFIREVLKWRKENEAEKAIKKDYHPELSEQFKCHKDGSTKTGFLAWSLHAGAYRFRETISKYGKEAVIYYWLQLLGKADALILEQTLEGTRNWRNNGENGDGVIMLPPIKKCWLIVNMAGFQFHEILSKDTISVFLTLAKMGVSYFPGLEGVVCFINAAKILEIFFKLLRPILHGTNVDILVFGPNEEQWKTVILEHVDSDQLRPTFGGTMESSE